MDVRSNPGFLHLQKLSAGGEWLHMCIRHRETSAYLMDVARLDDLIVEAMIEDDTRSRVRVRDDGIMVLLKAMHVRDNRMAMPEDMVSMRVWIDSNRVITTREADVDPMLVIAKRLSDGGGPATPGDFLVDLVEEHFNEVAMHIEQLEEAVDWIDNQIVRHQTEAVCSSMADTQTRISGFLRHLGPQRSVLERLTNCGHALIGERNRTRLDDGLNKILRFLETLRSLRERIEILNDQVSRIQDRQLSRSSYAFAVVTTLFLPLSFLTGLFGVNLAGIPMAEHRLAFTGFTVACVTLVAAIAIVLRAKRRF